MNIIEASKVTVAIASLELEGSSPLEIHSRYWGDIIRSNLKDATNTDLINLSKSTLYMRKFEHNKDLYSHVYAECVAGI